MASRKARLRGWGPGPPSRGSLSPRRPACCRRCAGWRLAQRRQPKDAKPQTDWEKGPAHSSVTPEASSRRPAPSLSRCSGGPTQSAPAAGRVMTTPRRAA
eukprot:scaffold4182_cov384-Prasinococcus_capsulatus_cf.AAC.13